MKISLNPSSGDYIGNYYSEYLLKKFIKRKSLTEIIKDRTSDKESNDEDKKSFLIKYKETNIYRFINKEIDTDRASYMEFINDLSKGHLKRITKEDHEEIKNLSIRYLNTDKYILDLALLVIYARLRCFKDRKEYLQGVQTIFSKKLRRDIINFYSLVAKERVNFYNIELKYDELIKDRPDDKERRETRKIIIDSPVIIKMMLYEFARKYFDVFEKIDIEKTETYKIILDGLEVENEYNYPVDYLFKDINTDMIKDDTLASSKKDFDTKRVAGILELYFKFITHENILEAEGQKAKIFGLIGNLLVMAGYEGYEDYKRKSLEDTYENENNYYYKRLIKYWKP